MRDHQEWFEVSEAMEFLGWSEQRVLHKVCWHWARRKLAFSRDVVDAATRKLLGVRWSISRLAIEDQYRKFGRVRSEGPVLKPTGQTISLPQLASLTGRTESSLRAHDLKCWEKMGLAKKAPMRGSKTAQWLVDQCVVPVAKARRAPPRPQDFRRGYGGPGQWN